MGDEPVEISKEDIDRTLASWHADLDKIEAALPNSNLDDIRQQLAALIAVIRRIIGGRK